MTTLERSIYEEQGYEGRQDYLNCLSQDNIELEVVFSLESILQDANQLF